MLHRLREASVEPEPESATSPSSPYPRLLSCALERVPSVAKREKAGQNLNHPEQMSKINRELTKANQNRSETKFYITCSEFNTQDSEGETFVTTSTQVFPTVGDGRNPINPVSHPLNMGFSRNPCSSGCKGQALLHAVLKQKCGQCGRAWDNSTRYSRISAIHACEMHV